MTYICVRATDIHSTQEWTSDPELVEVRLPLSVLATMNKAHAFVHDIKGVSADLVNEWFGYAFFKSAEDLDEDDTATAHSTGTVVTPKDLEYVPFTAEYEVCDTHLKVLKDGTVRAIWRISGGNEEVWAGLGALSALLAQEPEMAS